MQSTAARKILQLHPVLPFFAEMPSTAEPTPTLPPIPAVTAPVTWDEDTTLHTRAGTTRNRFGTSTQACKIMDNCDRKTLHSVLRTGLIYAYRMNEHKNSRWRIDLVGCTLYRENRRRRGSGLPPSQAWLDYQAHMTQLNSGQTSGAPSI